MSEPGWLVAMQFASEQKTRDMLKRPDDYFGEGRRPDGRREIVNRLNFLMVAVFEEDGKTIEYFTHSASPEWQRAVRLWLEQQAGR